MAGIVVAVLGGLNGWLMLQLKSQLGEIKLQISVGRSDDREWVRNWVECEFARKEALELRFSRLENRRRGEGRADS